MKIGFKLISAFLVVSVLIVVIGMISHEITKESLQSSIGDSSTILADEIISQIHKELVEDVILFQLLVKEPSMQNFIDSANQDFAEIENPYEYLDDADKEWMASENTITPFMKNLINSEMSNGLRMHQEYFKNVEGYDYFGEIFVTNSYGANIAQTGKTTDYKQSDEAWWQNAKEDGVHVGEIEYDNSAEIFARDISVRIADDEGHFQGVVKHVVNVEKIFHIIDGIHEKKKFQSQEITLLDDTGRVVYSTASLFDKSGESFLQDYPQKSILEKMNKNTGYFIDNEISQDEKLFAYSFSTNPQFGENTWTVILEYDAVEIFEPISNLRNFVLTISFMTSAASILFGLYISSSISKPITLLKEAFAKIKQGDFSNPVLVTSNDEFGELSKSFTKMSGDLQKNLAIEKELAIARSNIKNEKLAGIGQVAARLAHDLRNPLSVIKTQIKLFKAGGSNFDEKTNNGILRIERAVERMNHQLENVLDFIRIRPIELETKNLKEVINSSVDSFPKYPGVQINTPNDDVTIVCDPIQLGIVFNNIIYNSIQAIDQLGIINIEIHETNEDIVINFQDSGDGIADDKLEKIFEPLYTTKQQGTGLGLSSCKTIIEQHNGTISISNNPTTFTIHLPKILKQELNTSSS